MIPWMKNVLIGAIIFAVVGPFVALALRKLIHP